MKAKYLGIGAISAGVAIGAKALVQGSKAVVDNLTAGTQVAASNIGQLIEVGGLTTIIADNYISTRRTGELKPTAATGVGYGIMALDDLHEFATVVAPDALAKLGTGMLYDAALAVGLGLASFGCGKYRHGRAIKNQAIDAKVQMLLEAYDGIPKPVARKMAKARNRNELLEVCREGGATVTVTPVAPAAPFVADEIDDEILGELLHDLDIE